MSAAVSPVSLLAKRLLRGKVLVFTGAGMSTASGLPDFRSAAQGLWTQFDPMKLATVTAMRKNYSDFHAFYSLRLQTLASASPNLGHTLIADWERSGHVYGVLTQNVDGFHINAGSRKVAELHGRLNAIRCMDCSQQFSVSQFLKKELCSCGGKLRPGVVLFGESLPESQLRSADEMLRNCETLLTMGSSLQVFPAADLPRQAKIGGAVLIIANNEPTHADSFADLVVREPICDFLAAAQRELAKLLGSTS
jgi:NAD-dependent deacetylase